MILTSRDGQAHRKRHRCHFFWVLPDDRGRRILRDEPPINLLLRIGDFPNTLSQLLIDASPTEFSHPCLNPISLAVIEDCQESLRLLLDAETPPSLHCTPAERTGQYIDHPIHYAIRWLRLDILEVLVKHDRVDLNARNGQGFMPLQMAMQLNHKAKSFPTPPLFRMKRDQYITRTAMYRGSGS